MEGAATKGDIEPAGQQVEKACKAAQQRELELVVVCQIDQDRAQARLQHMETACKITKQDCKSLLH